MSISTPIETRQISRSKLTFEIDKNSTTSDLTGIPDTSNESLAGEDITAYSLVYLDSAGLIRKADYTTNEAVALVIQDLLENDPVSLISEGNVSMPSHGFSIGERLFLSSGTPNFSTTVPTLTSGNILQNIGYVKNADTIYLDIDIPITFE